MTQVKKTLKLLRRSPYQALAAILAMSLTFFISSIFVVMIVGGQVILNYIEQRPQVIAFFKDDVTETQINDVIANVKASTYTKEVKYITKEEKSDIMVWYSNFATKSPRKLDRLINTLNTNFSGNITHVQVLQTASLKVTGNI